MNNEVDLGSELIKGNIAQFNNLSSYNTLDDILINNNLDINTEQSILLSKIVSKYLKMINNTTDSINYKEEIINLNKICEDIMKN